ncbi:hypothetical protein SRHO_G00213920 [Serrasalmus rhombeus]
MRDVGFPISSNAGGSQKYWGMWSRGHGSVGWATEGWGFVEWGSASVCWVEARVRHASISGETVQLPRPVVFKPCQLPIRLPAKLCMCGAGLVRATAVSFHRRAAESESEGEPAVDRRWPPCRGVIFYFSASSARLVRYFHNGCSLRALAAELDVFKLEHTHTHSVSLRAPSPSPLIPLSPSNLGCLRGPGGTPASSLAVTLSPFILTPSPPQLTPQPALGSRSHLSHD